MRAQRLLSLDLPVLALTDQVARALQVMDELKLMHLAVVEEDVYKGTVSEEALLELDESALIAEAPMTLGRHRSRPARVRRGRTDGLGGRRLVARG